MHLSLSPVMCSSLPRTPSPLQSRRILCVREDSVILPRPALSISSRSERGSSSSIWVAALAIVFSAVCISATLLYISSLSHHGLRRTPPHATTELLIDSGCRCYSTALIGTLVSPAITGGGTWDQPVFTANLTTPRMVQINGSVSVTMGAGVGTGTGAYATITGGAMAGSVTVRTSSIASTAVTKPLFTVTFSTPYPATPTHITINPYVNYNSARLATTAMPYIYSTNSTGFVVYMNTAALAVNTIYVWGYLVIG